MLTLWCLMRSPLMLGCDLRHLDDWTLGLVTNARVLRVLKDSFGARPLFRTEKEAAWLAQRRDNGEVYLALFNLDGEEREISVSADTLGLPGPLRFRELWSGEQGEHPRHIGALIPAHGAKLFLLSNADTVKPPSADRGQS